MNKTSYLYPFKSYEISYGHRVNDINIFSYMNKEVVKKINKSVRQKHLIPVSYPIIEITKKWTLIVGEIQILKKIMD